MTWPSSCHIMMYSRNKRFIYLTPRRGHHVVAEGFIQKPYFWFLKSIANLLLETGVTYALYQIKVHKNNFVADCKHDNQWFWNWITSITTPLKNAQFLNLCSILEHITISWDLDDDGLFTVKGVRKYLEELMLH